MNTTQKFDYRTAYEGKYSRNKDIGNNMNEVPYNTNCGNNSQANQDITKRSVHKREILSRILTGNISKIALKITLFG